MELGAVFPQSDVEIDAIAAKDWAQAAEELGYSHILLYDHVLGADREHHQGWDGFHDSQDRWHEVFTLLGYLAAVTDRIGLATGVLCLPQRQAALVAKQAATVDLLSGGRFRLGVSVGWNHVEYEALGMGFADRGERIVEQIELMRQLWTQRSVDFHGKFHDVSYAGLYPLPARSIPIWYGSRADRILPRVARFADGWLPDSREPDIVEAQLEILRRECESIGRDPATLGLEARISLKQGGPDLWREYHRRYQAMGFDFFTVGTIWSGAETIEGHIEALDRFRREVKESNEA